MAVTDEQKRDWKFLDDWESRVVKARSGGRCEVTEGWLRCHGRATEVHHHIGGWKRRGRGDSALAEHKSHVCRVHHREIHGHVLTHVLGNRYRRVA